MTATIEQRREHDQFEENVRLIAQQLFPGKNSQGDRIILGRERDGIFDDGETFHIFESTVSRRKQKIEDDIDKSAKLVSQLRRENPEYNVKIWIVTSDPPTSDQEEAAKKGRKKARCPVELLSYTALYNKLFDARQLLDFRANYPFGSIRNPMDDSSNVPESAYVTVGFADHDDGSGVSPLEVVGKILDGNYRSVMLGDFGAGKSMALRYIYFQISDAFHQGKSRRFPVYLNLRDHFGQIDPAEALMRHARRIGVDYNRLIAAWRAGFVDLILDGFDELSPTQFSTEVRNLRSARRAAAELVSKFVEESPVSSSIVVSGRRHYFDSLKEMRAALGFSSTVQILNLGEFTDEQIKEFLDKNGLSATIPVWLPRRPLLIGYLAANDLLHEVSDKEDCTVSKGWDFLIERICEREVRQISGTGVEAATLRRLLESLATYARALEGGRGPIPATQIISVYERIIGQPADARTQTLLLRLPGLATVAGQEEAREFLDDDFVDACRMGDARRFLNFPFDDSVEYEMVQFEGGDVLLDALREECERLSRKQVSSALTHASDNNYSIFALDIVKAIYLAGINIDLVSINIKDCYIRDLDIFSDVDCSSVTFVDCWIEALTLAYADEGLEVANMPKFHDCVVETLIGLTRRGDLPQDRFTGSTNIENFVGIASSNAALLTAEELPLSVAVLLTILKKAFFQAGGGRQEAAFYRGLDHRAKAYVPDILKILERFSFIEKSNRAGSSVWRANKEKLGEARAMRDAPMKANHSVLQAVRALS